MNRAGVVALASVVVGCSLNGVELGNIADGGPKDQPDGAPASVHPPPGTDAGVHTGQDAALSVSEAGPVPDGASDGGVNACPISEGSDGVVLASGQSHRMRSPAVDSSNVYWVVMATMAYNDGAIGAVGKAGGAATILASAQLDPLNLTSDGTYVYWANPAPPVSNAGMVMQVLGSGGAPSVFWTQTLANPFAIATDGVNVFWANSGPTEPVLSEPLGGGAVASYPSSPSGPWGASLAIAVDASMIYFFDNTANSVLAVPKAGGAVTTLATNQSTPVALAVDGIGGVYWVNQDNGTVMASHAGAPAVTVASGQDTPVGVASDGTDVYWVTSVGGTIARAPLQGGSVTVLASNEQGSSGLAVDGSDVYWVNNCFGTVKKVAK